MLRIIAAIVLAGLGLLSMSVFALPTLFVLTSPDSQGIVALLIPFLLFGMLLFLAGLRVGFGPTFMPSFAPGLWPRKRTADVDGHLARVAQRHLDDMRGRQPRLD